MAPIFRRLDKYLKTCLLHPQLDHYHEQLEYHGVQWGMSAMFLLSYCSVRYIAETIPVFGWYFLLVSSTKCCFFHKDTIHQRLVTKVTKTTHIGTYVCAFMSARLAVLRLGKQSYTYTYLFLFIFSFQTHFWKPLSTGFFRAKANKAKNVLTIVLRPISIDRITRLAFLSTLHLAPKYQRALLYCSTVNNTKNYVTRQDWRS